MLESRFTSLKEVAVSAEVAALKGVLAKFFPEACAIAATGTCLAAATGSIQGLFGAIGSVLGVVYLVYRIKKIRKEK